MNFMPQFRLERLLAGICAPMLIFSAYLGGQVTPPASAPPTITIEDALARARQYAGQIQSASYIAQLAGQDVVQARAAALPNVGALNQFIYTEGNGTPEGVFVSNNGVHIYDEQVVVHQELLSAVRRGEIRRAMAAEAVARARVDIASRGLSLVIVQDYYAVAVAQRRLVNSQTILGEAQRFYDITQRLEQGGEAAHSDVVRAQIDLQQRQRDVVEAQLAIVKAKIGLGVMIFPAFTADFFIVDNLQQMALLPPPTEVQSTASSTSPDLRAARAGVQETELDVRVAHYGYLPSFGLDFAYGIDANQFAVRTHYPPGSDPAYRQNLGYVAQATLNVPIWTWGAIRSRIKQAEFRRDQSQLDLNLAQRNLDSTAAGFYAEAQAAQSQLASLSSSVTLATENQRLVLLRYQAGEATALEVVDAQNTLTLARNANDDGLGRFRVALTNLQILMGTL